MFKHILAHFARRHTARRRSEVLELQTQIQELKQKLEYEERLFWEDRSSLRDHLIRNDRYCKALAEENFNLRQRLDVAHAELQGKISRQEAREMQS